MSELYIPEGIPEVVKQRILADKDYILKYQELSKTHPDWATMTQEQRKTLARTSL